MSIQSNLAAVTEDTILVTLHERYQAGHPYTLLSPSALVFFNPYNVLPCDGETSLSQHVDEYYRCTNEASLKEKNARQPHVFQLALSAFYNMKRTGQDQAIITNGAVGSGKTELKRMAIEAISQVSISTSSKKGSKIGLQVSSAEFILKCFGNAHTLSNDDASRFGAYTELQFSARGRLEGLKTIQYYFERSRVSQVPVNGERNFHIFYYLLSGLPTEERSFLKLGDISEYRYLQCRVHRIGVEDRQRFVQLKQAFKLLGMSSRLVAQVFQLLAAILHIGNLQFAASTDPSHEGASVTNYDTIAIAAEFLGVSPEALAELFSLKTIMVRKEVCTTFLSPEQAEQVRDELARTLFSLLFSWLNEHINSKLCKDSFGSFIALLDLPGIQRGSGPTPMSNSLDQFCLNFGAERLHNWILFRIHETPTQEAQKERLSLNRIPYFDNSECLEMFSGSRGGLIGLMDDLSQKKKTESNLLDALGKRFGTHPSISLSSSQGWKSSNSFTINHYNGPVTYSTANFLEKNANETSTDIVQLLRGNVTQHVHLSSEAVEAHGSSNPFIKGLFSMKNIATQSHPRSDSTIVAAQQPVRPVRAPSMRKRKDRPLVTISEKEEDNVIGGNEESYADKELRCIAGQHLSAIQSLLQSFEQTQLWYIFCICPNDSQLPSQVDLRSVKGQTRSLGVAEIAQKLQTCWEVQLPHIEACTRYQKLFRDRNIAAAQPVDKLRDFKKRLQLNEFEMGIGLEQVFFSHSVFHFMEDSLRLDEDSFHDDSATGQPRKLQIDPFSPHQTSSSAYSPTPPPHSYHQNDSSSILPLMHHAQPLQDPYDAADDLASTVVPYTTPDIGTESNAELGGYSSSRSLFSDAIHKGEKDPLDKDAYEEDQVQEEYRESMARRRWVWLCTILTFWIPTFILSKLGRMKRQDIRQAWREKLAINMIIWFICGCTVFVIAILGPLICPRQHVYSTNELASHSYKQNPNNAFVAIRGEVFDLSQFASTHLTTVSVVPTKSIMQYGGLDASELFPVQVSALCGGKSGSISQFVTLDSTNTSEPFAQYHDFRASTNDSRPDWYSEMMIMMRHRFRVGFMGHSRKDIKNMAASGKAVAIYNDLVYDMSDYIRQNGGGLKAPNGVNLSAQDQADRQFMADEVISLFKYNSGKDITKLLDEMSSTIGSDALERQKVCLRNLFILGKLDTRDSAQCQFSTYILLALSIVMFAIIGFKFLAALHFGSERAPENHDKFVICQVPCYTEGEDSLRRTIDSLVKLKYDDKRKLIMVICDGNIKGYGNDKPTPAIVLDILGVDPNSNAEPLSFQSLGEGAKQHNMGKVYAGLYECAGHVVPYLVVVKVGKPNERSKPGNRGKRDSQMVIMHFLNKIHFNSLMNPLELEMYHQIKNVIGVNPSFYEYIFMVDADTTVDEMSLNRLVSAMMHDKKIIGVCGETSIANSKQSIVTMSQVYEYFISHHLAKAFESLFGSITCLPGCFSMYRLRSPDNNKPLFIANGVIQDYSENRVDTLHLKNLLHLGEDRYLTTLVLKHFVDYKTKFVRDAYAQTVAPDSIKVLLSQRRRWINSTVHNLAELVFLDQLCGFCCFSMRFVVLIDLVSTIVAPVTVAYIGYLIYLVVHDGSSIPILSIIMLAAIYGLQALVFVFRLRWDMVAWMVFYILAIPAFSFFLPLYSFWKMDDFSWGSTRLVVGDKGKKIVIHDEGKFDSQSIPLKSWEEYENELWDHDSANSETYQPLNKESYEHRPQSIMSYGGFTNPHPQSYYAPSMYSNRQMKDQRYHPESTESRHDDVNPFAGSPWQGNRQVQTSPYHQMYYGGSFQTLPRPDSTTQLYDNQNRSYENLATQAPEPQTTVQSETFAASLDYLGSKAISDAQLESSIRNICKDADLDKMTKKGVRLALEKKYGVGLEDRRDAINRILEKILTGRYF
nr:chitin synthase [Cryptococcus depauperatus CBS 7841]